MTEIENAINKLKFLFITGDKFPPFRVDVDVLFGKEMVARGHCIDWLMQSEAPCDGSYETTWHGCRVWVGPTDTGTTRLKRLKKNLYNIRNDFKMISLVRKNKYDFIQVKNKFISALLGIVISNIYKTKFIYWLSFPFPELWLYQARMGIARYPWLYFIRGLIFKFLLYHVIMPKADHIFVQSEKMKKDVASMRIPETKLTPVPMGVSLEMIPRLPIETDSLASTGNKIVLYLGTLMKERRIDFLIRVFEKVVREVPNAKLYLVGGGEDPVDEQMLRDEAARLGIEDAIVFTGFIPRQKAWHYVSKSDVCVSPFYPIPILNSTSPTKLIEYMAMGKPVVANDPPEQRLVISESGGGFCVPYKEARFASAIVELLNDPEKATEMGLKGRCYVEKHRTYRTIADMVERKYLSICSASAGRGFSDVEERP